MYLLHLSEDFGTLDQDAQVQGRFLMQASIHGHGPMRQELSIGIP